MNEQEDIGASIYRKVKDGLGVALQVLLAAPVKLPAKLLNGARYLVMLLGLLDGLERVKRNQEEADTTEKGQDEQPGT